MPFSRPHAELFPQTITTGRSWRTSESTSISEKPAAPSPSSSDDLSRRSGDPGGDGGTKSGAETAIGARVEPATGALRLDELAGEAHEVATVADHHRVVGQPRHELAIDPGRVDRVGLGREECGIAFGSGPDGLLQGAHPGAQSGLRTERVGQTREDAGEVTGSPPRQFGMRRDLSGGVGKVHDLGGGRAVLAAEDSVAQPEVQRRTGHDHEIRGAERLAAGLRDEQWVTSGGRGRDPCRW